ncbi:MAG: phytanoyl-CoA dioxygenase family protein [Planctomycetaceae bacterium]|nr:phytanoyl-CoA dioxygenase family protein [Planctomycetaceae bacterium]
MTDKIETTLDRFTEDEVSSFQENGYLIVRHLLDDATRQAMRERTLSDLEALVEPIEYEAELQYPGAPESIQAEGGKTPRRLKTAHSRDPIFLETLKRPEFLNRLQQLLGPTIIMPTAHHNCIMTKEPDYSSDTGWHQDIRYWRFEQRNLVTVWMALGDEYPENGSLKVISGSHQKIYTPEQFDEELFLREDLSENQELLSNVEHLSLSAGDVLFFHCRTFHAATRNYTDQPKYSAVFTFRGGDNAPIEGSRSASMPEITLSEG